MRTVSEFTTAVRIAVAWGGSIWRGVGKLGVMGLGVAGISEDALGYHYSI
jgi:hypothetical protein